VELAKVFTTIRRYFLLILASTAVAATAGYLAQRQQPSMYASSATVIVGRAFEDLNPSNSEFFAGQQLAATYTEIATRGPIKEAAMSALELNGLPYYTVSQVPNTNLLEIRVSDTDPRRAQAVANELARQLVALSPGAQGKLDPERRAFIDKQIQEMEIGIEETTAQIVAQKELISGLYSARDLAAAEEQIAALERKLSGLQSTYASLIGYLEGGVNTVQIVEWAEMPGRPVDAGGLRTILVLAAMGLMLGLGAALLLEYLDDTLRSPQDVQENLSLPVLGGIPRKAGPEPQNTLALSGSTQSPDLEAYRLLRTNIEFASGGASLMLTSAAPGEGKTSIVSNLGRVIAQEGKRVVLVDSDLRRPTLHQLFGLSMGEGLSDALSSQGRNAVSYLRQTDDPNLRVMTAGTTAGNPAVLLKSERLSTLLAELCQDADAVLLDSAPMLAATDALAVASKVQGVLLIVDVGRTQRKMAIEAMQMLASVDANLLGVALNRVKPEVSTYHQYANYYATDRQSDDQSLMGRMKGRLRWSPNRKTS
jgi:capsular exopolysaccharide synthesis family protein